MLKQCPYFNCTMSNMKFPLISCKGRHNSKTVKFIHEEGRDKYFNDFCCNNYKGCSHHKIIKYKEVEIYVE